MVSPDFPAMRRAMIDSQLRTSGVNEPWIIAAMAALPREKFVSADRMSTAYMDRAIPLEPGRALNPPLVAGSMLMAAGLRGDDAVLLVGVGSGYLAQLIAPRVASLCAVEPSAGLVVQARSNLTASGNVQVVDGPLEQGHPKSAPYSLIIIDGAVSTLPEALVAQLADGGRVVTGMFDGAVSRLAIGYKSGGSVVLRAISDMEIAPLPGFERVSEFVF